MELSPFPEIQTERLLLRRLERSDWEIILFLRSDKTVNKFIQRPEHRKTKNKADAIRFIKEINEERKNKKSISWGITLKGHPGIVGTICLWNFSNDHTTAEVGYDLNPEFQKRGIMDEALKSVINFGWGKLNLHKIEAFTHKENESSIRLLEKNRFNCNEDRKDEDNPNNLIFELKRLPEAIFNNPA